MTFGDESQFAIHELVENFKPRWFIDHQTGEKVIDNENSLITIRITYESMRLEYSTGYHINAACWDANRTIGKVRDP